LGVSAKNIKVTGNMKFDLNDYTDLKIDYTDYKSRLGLGPQDKLFVAASTHAGEEGIVLGAYKDLLKDFAGLRLLIAPRHPERSGEVEKIIIRRGFQARKISQLANCPAGQLGRPIVFILDSVGQLMNYYAVADIVLVGGSLVKKGGHNILEPATFAKPILCGPHMFNFRDIAELFLSNNALDVVHNQQELVRKVRYLLSLPFRMSELGQRAKGLIAQNQGATGRNLREIAQFFKSQNLAQVRPPTA
jgi:3-deoxy-D-manno-octulosonic-acid transferase